MRDFAVLLAWLRRMSSGQFLPRSIGASQVQSSKHFKANKHARIERRRDPSEIFAMLLLVCTPATSFNPSTLQVSHHLVWHAQVSKNHWDSDTNALAQPILLLSKPMSTAHLITSMRVQASPLFTAPSGGDATSTARTVFALDFDGVVCDSEPESSLSAWKHGLQLFPDVFGAPEADAQKARVMDELRQVRPVVETGFENTILARALLEQISGHTVSDIIAGWGSLMPALMEQWGLDRAEMVAGYGKIRDDWMEQDLAGWLAPNSIYPGVAEACIAAEESALCDVFIVTTKQTRFARAIMSENGDLHIPDDRIFSQTVSGLPKTVVLADLAKAAAPGVRKMFVEDKFSTLEKVCGTDGLEDWELFLVDWGYNTPAEREQAVANPRIQVIGVEAFVAMLHAAAGDF